MSGVLSGCAPAWQAGRANLAEVMKEGGRLMSGGRHGLRRALVVVEFALALTLLAGGGMTVSALLRLMSVDLGFRGARTLTFVLPVARGRLATAGEMEGFYRSVLDCTNARARSHRPRRCRRGCRLRGQFRRRVRYSRPARRRFAPAPRAGINMVTPRYPQDTRHPHCSVAVDSPSAIAPAAAPSSSSIRRS